MESLAGAYAQMISRPGPASVGKVNAFGAKGSFSQGWPPMSMSKSCNSLIQKRGKMSVCVVR